jgi:hypothetical protein
MEPMLARFGWETEQVRLRERFGDGQRGGQSQDICLLPARSR